ncbi:aa3-type cytochrome c oxidase subunit IV [Enterovirga sp.]|uniref:aa3-type cytochrome c oxidase subunit IV n=1 Tax=Enterovirga sp. TaxID=2026350 RepID=UPI002CA8A289|nr:aa3-type cytochrome c oxidase subunit IV [Enterovirga sp.]HMO28978.1 aa3-type cytochrome c oxidase subunit IV [Enterovirga sp.]
MAQTSMDPAAAYRPEMDGKAHERTYGGFLHFAVVGTVFVACIVVALAVGGVRHAWPTAAFMVILAHVAAAIGLVSAAISWRAPAAILVLLLIMLLLY